MLNMSQINLVILILNLIYQRYVKSSDINIIILNMINMSQINIHVILILNLNSYLSLFNDKYFEYFE